MADVQELLARLAGAAGNPLSYARDWKQRTQGKVVGILPMNFPQELVHATGALPVVIQEGAAPITLGRGFLFEYYCGYTRSLIDQAATGQFDDVDAFFLVDHCVALLGAADAMRFAMPGKPIVLAQFAASMDEPWNRPSIGTNIGYMRQRLSDLCQVEITDARLSRSIAIYNENRRLLRQLYELRRSGELTLSSVQMQLLVQSSMVMDVEDHTRIITDLIPLLGSQNRRSGVRVHLSGHFCHAPPPDLLQMIESCGGVVIDDDLFTGFRFIATDVPTAGDPADALLEWYFARNTNVPCATRAQKSVDWETFLAASVEKNRADAVIMLMPKFCEPHMLYYPELRKELDRRAIPHLLIETEHEGLPLESLRTRVEALMERVQRGAPASTVHA